MKTLRTHGLFRLVRLAPMVVLCVAIGLLSTQQGAEGWSAGPIFGLTDVPPGGAHGKMAENAILWLDSNNLLPAGYLSAQDRQLLREGASTPDGIWGVGPGLKNTFWWEGALQVEALIGRDIVELGIFGYSCTDEPCFTFKDDWENDFDNLMNHEFADLSVWNPIKYWADKAKQDLINNNRSRAMVHAGYAVHFAEDFLNPPHLGSLLWGSYQEVDWPSELELAWENTDFNYVPKAWSFNDFRIVGRCFTSNNAFPFSFESDLLSYRHSNALAWPAPLPSLAWIYDQGQPGVLLDQRIANAVMWSEQAAHEVIQYVFDLKIFADVPPGFWAENYICAIYNPHITMGYGDGTYRPLDLVNREQMAAFIIRAVVGEPPDNYCDSGSTFNDVTSGMWSCKYIKRLKELGITKGYENGTIYKPYEFVPRDQMAAFLSRAFLGMP